MRLVPFFKEDFGASRQGCCGSLNDRQLPLHAFNQGQSFLPLPHHGGYLVHHGENFCHAALVENGDLHTLTNQLGGNVRLQVRKAKYAVRLQCQNFVNFGAGKSTHPWLLIPRPAWPHGVA